MFIIAEIGQAHEGTFLHRYSGILGLDGNYRFYETQLHAGDQDEWQ